MARVKLELPERFCFSTDIQLRIGDINYGGHLGNDSVLSLVHEARVQILAQHGFSESDICGVGIIQADAILVYKSEGFHGQTLTIDVAVADFSRTGCDFYYRLTNRETGTEVARAKTGIVFFDYTKHRPVAVPDDFRAQFAPGNS